MLLFDCLSVFADVADVGVVVGVVVGVGVAG
jgi:hypothetical protein